MGMEHYVKVNDLGGTNGAFLARDRQQPDRLVVIKRLADGMQGMEELNASLRLRHPNIIRFLESFLFEGGLYVVMHYEQGGDLEELFLYLTQRHKTPTTHTLLLWFVQLLEALAFCHAHHVIHRDIKPSNILVSEDTKVLYLGDFGSAKTLDTSNVTSTFVGSPLWISPEVLMGTKYSYAADIWSLGCVFYEMATLRKPFTAPSFAHLVQQITRGHVAPLPAGVAPEVRAIIHSMLRLQPAERATAADALDVARVALREADVRRNVTPTPIRSPAPPANMSAVSSPLRPPPAMALELAEPAAPTPPPPPAPPLEEEPAVSSLGHSADNAGVLRASANEASATATPASHTSPPVTTLHTTATSSDAGHNDNGTPPPPPPVAAAAATPIPKSTKSPTAAAVKKRRTGGTSSPSASTRSNTPTPVPTAAASVATTDLGAAATDAADGTEPSLTASTAEPCEPQQMILNISTGAFRKPAARKKPVAGRNGAAARPAAAAAAVGAPSQQSHQPRPQRRQVNSVPASAPPGEAPNFVRQPTAESTAGRRRSTTSAAEVVSEQRSSLGAPEPKVVVKAVPPRALAARAKTAAENGGGRSRVPATSPTRAAAVPPPPLVSGAAARQAPQPSPMVPKAAAAGAGGRVPADQWLDERMRELSAMENYLYQHRVGDDKVLQTYDARRNEEYSQQEAEAAVAARPPPRRSPAPRRLSPSKAFASPTRSPGVLLVSPPAQHKPPPPPPQQQQQGRHGAASPFARQPSYARQASYARQSSYTGGPQDSRQGSLASTFNGRQASNARPHQAISDAEHQRLEEERAAAREKREAERQRMKALIQEQRAAAKQQKRKPKKGSAKGSMEVDVLVPDHKPVAAVVE